MTILPIEAETAPESLTLEQTRDMLKDILKTGLGMQEPIYIEDNTICISSQFKLFKGGIYWTCQYSSPGADGWSPCYPIVSRDPLKYFPRIVQCFARKKLDIWLMTKYHCMA